MTYRWSWRPIMVALLLSLMWHGSDAAAQEVLSTLASDTVKTATKPTPPIHRERKAITISDTATVGNHPVRVVNAAGDTLTFASIDSIRGIDNVEILMDSTASPTLGKVRTFNPDPQRALWLSALCPGLGQILKW